MFLKVMGLGLALAAAAPGLPAQEARVAPAPPLAVDLGQGVSLTLMPIPAGTFLMGDKARVTLGQPFWMGRNDVTVAQFRRFVTETGYRTEAEQGDGAEVWAGTWRKLPDASWRKPYLRQTEEHPVVCVTWNDAQAFVTWLSRKGQGTFRLPTEAEWEHACRAGSTAATYGPLDAIAWYDANAGRTTHPVGQKRANAYGLQDTLGNVWQWCQDRFGPGPAVAATDPTGPASGTFRIIKGGSFRNRAAAAAAGSRSGLEPGWRASYLGFRVVRVQPGR